MNILVLGATGAIGNFLTDNLKSPLVAFSHQSADVTRLDQLERCAEELKKWGHLDAVIYCVGVQGKIAKMLDTHPDEWKKAIDVNLIGLQASLFAFKGLLRACPRRAKVIAFSGGGATFARQNLSAYAASKCALVRTVETLAEEETSWLDANSIAPGMVYSQMTEEMIAAGPELVGEKDYRNCLKVKETGNTETLQKVIRLVEFLLSPASDGFSGRLISAPWDWDPKTDKPLWEDPSTHTNDAYRLRRIEPKAAK